VDSLISYAPTAQNIVRMHCAICVAHAPTSTHPKEARGAPKIGTLGGLFAGLPAALHVGEDLCVGFSFVPSRAFGGVSGPFTVVDRVRSPPKPRPQIPYSAICQVSFSFLLSWQASTPARAPSPPPHTPKGPLHMNTCTPSSKCVLEYRKRLLRNSTPPPPLPLYPTLCEVVKRSSTRHFSQGPAGTSPTTPQK